MTVFPFKSLPCLQGGGRSSYLLGRKVSCHLYRGGTERFPIDVPKLDELDDLLDVELLFLGAYYDTVRRSGDPRRPGWPSWAVELLHESAETRLPGGWAVQTYLRRYISRRLIERRCSWVAYFAGFERMQVVMIDPYATADRHYAILDLVDPQTGEVIRWRP